MGATWRCGCGPPVSEVRGERGEEVSRVGRMGRGPLTRAREKGREREGEDARVGRGLESAMGQNGSRGPLFIFFVQNIFLI